MALSCNNFPVTVVFVQFSNGAVPHGVIPFRNFEVFRIIAQLRGEVALSGVVDHGDDGAPFRVSFRQFDAGCHIAAG